MALATDDILAIQKLVADYNHLVDAGDGEGFAALFVDGGSLDTGFNVVKGTRRAARLRRLRTDAWHRVRVIW